MRHQTYIYADTFRLLTLALTTSAIASFPLAVFKQGRHWSAGLAVAGCECFMLAAVVMVADRFNQPVEWYRTPLAFTGAILILTFNYHVFMANRKESK